MQPCITPLIMGKTHIFPFTDRVLEGCFESVRHGLFNVKRLKVQQWIHERGDGKICFVPTTSKGTFYSGNVQCPDHDHKRTKTSNHRTNHVTHISMET